MKGMAKIIIAAGLLLSFIGCATSIRMEVTRPAEVNMAGAKRVAVLDFGYPPDGDRILSFNEIWALALAKALGIEQTKERPLKERMAAYVTESMIAALINTNYFEVINPGDVSAAMKNSGSRQADPIMVGQMVGAQAIIVGDITKFVNKQTEHWEEETVKDKDTGLEYTIQARWLKREITITLTYRTVNTATGAIMATKTLEDSEIDDLKYDNRSQLGSDEEVCKQIINGMVPIIAKQIAPYKEVIYRSLMKDKTKDPDMKAADELVKGSMFDNAREIFLKVWKDTQNPAAGVNAGITYEAVGDLDSALRIVKEVVDNTANSTAMREYKRLLNEKKSLERLKEQLQ
jgi:curli biogenesis system outer membrane secretion channel CsgG